MRKITLTLVATICCLVSPIWLFLPTGQAFAQTIPQQEWVQTFNGAVSLNDGAFVVDVDGSIVVSGVTETNPGTFKILTVKYDQDGTQLWAVMHNSPGLFLEADFANFVATDNVGNIYIAASVAIGSGGGDKEFITIKYNSSGVQQWVATHPDTGEAYSLAIDPSGNVYVTGWTKTGTPTKEDFTTVKYNSSGVEQWTVKYGGLERDIANSIALDGTGNIYITGTNLNTTTNRANHTTIKYNNSGVQQWATTFTNGSFAFTGNEQRSVVAASNILLDAGDIYVTAAGDNSGTADYVTIKYNNSGVQQWISIFNGTGAGKDYISDIDILTTGDVVVTGESFGGSSDADFVTIQYDPSGTEQWVQQYNGTANGADRARGLDIDNANNIYVTGVSFNGTNNDFATIKYSTLGIQEWDIAFDGTANGNDEANDIGVDATGNVYVVGLSFNGANFDYTTVKYSQVITSPIIITTLVIDESCEAAGEGSIDLTVTGGIPPYTFLWSNGATTEDVDSLTAGIYIVTVTDNLGTVAIESAIINDSPPDPKDPPSCSELFISEYVEGSGQNKAIELYNPTDDTIALNNYFLRVFMNGAPTPLISQLIGVILPKQTHVIAHPNANSAILAVADQTSNKMNFNGDDPVQLIKVLNNIPINIDSIEGIGGNPHAIFDTLDLDTIDHVGIPGVWPGNQGYSVGSGTTKNSTLIRKAGVTTGKEDWACGQKQWNVNGVDNTSNLKQHQCKCKLLSVDLFFSFQNPEETTDTAGNKYFEFDIEVKASDTGTYFNGIQIYIKYDTLSFGSFIAGNVTLTLSPFFDTVTYLLPNFANETFNTGRIQMFLKTPNPTPNRTLIPVSNIQLFRLSFEIKNCNSNSGIAFNTDTLLNNTASYILNCCDTATFGGGFGYANFFENEIDLILCEMNIFSFTSPVYPGTYCSWCSDSTLSELIIQGIGFGNSKGQAYFKNADNGGQTYIRLNALDIQSWADNEIIIRMPSLIDTIYLPDDLPTPGSGTFYIKNSLGDSVISNTEIEMPYGIKNVIDLFPQYQKVRLDLLNADKADSVDITFFLGPSITNHPDTLVELIVRRAVKDWACLSRANIAVGGGTGTDVTTADGVSVIHLVPSFPSSTTLAETAIHDVKLGQCDDFSGIQHIFPTEIDIALLEDPSTVNAGTWFFDTLGKALPANRRDFYEAILHELGHALLLQHVNPDSLMFWQTLFNQFDSIPGSNLRFIDKNAENGVFDVVSKGESILLDTICNPVGSNAGTLILTPDKSCIGFISGISDVKTHEYDLILYPNPTEGIIYFKGEFKLPAVFLLYDMAGRKIFENNISSREEEINLHGVSKGLYLFRLLSKDRKQWNGKIIIEK